MINNGHTLDTFDHMKLTIIQHFPRDSQIEKETMKDEEREKERQK